MGKSDALKALREREAMKMSGKAVVKAVVGPKKLVDKQAEGAKYPKSDPIAEVVCKTTGKADRRKQNKGRPPSKTKKIPSEATATTTQLTKAEKTALKSKFVSIRDAVLWAIENKK